MAQFPKVKPSLGRVYTSGSAYIADKTGKPLEKPQKPAKPDYGKVIVKKGEDLKEQNTPSLPEGYSLKHTVDMFGSKDPTHHQHRMVITSPDNQEVGHFIFENVDNKWMPTSNNVHQDHRRKGLTSYAHDLFESRVGELHPHVSKYGEDKHSDDFKAYWANRIKLKKTEDDKEKSIKDCPSCKTHLTTKNTKFEGIQDLSGVMDHDLSLHTCNNCGSTATVEIPRKNKESLNKTEETLEKTTGNIKQRGTGISRGSSETRFIGQSVVGRPYSNPSGSSKEQVKHLEQQLKAKNKLQPVKIYSEEEKAELARKMGLNKSEKLTFSPNGQWTLTYE